MSQIVSWRRDVEETVIRCQFERSSQVLVLGLYQHGVTHISEKPEWGKYMPYFGMTSGGFEFAFHPTGGKIELTVSAVPGLQRMVHPNSVEPLKLAFSGNVVHAAEVHEGVGTTGLDDMILYLPEFLFGFYGKFFDTFRAWKMYNEDYEQLEFVLCPYFWRGGSNQTFWKQ